MYVCSDDFLVQSKLYAVVKISTDQVSALLCILRVVNLFSLIISNVRSQLIAIALDETDGNNI